jgi:hypothetical protein
VASTPHVNHWQSKTTTCHKYSNKSYHKWVICALCMFMKLSSYYFPGIKERSTKGVSWGVWWKGLHNWIWIIYALLLLTLFALASNLCRGKKEGNISWIGISNTPHPDRDPSPPVKSISKKMHTHHTETSCWSPEGHGCIDHQMLLPNGTAVWSVFRCMERHF